MIQTTSLHDILWHFVASLTPSPFEPEEEEEEENKGNKDTVEQVRLHCTNVSSSLDFTYTYVFQHSIDVSYLINAA